LKRLYDLLDGNADKALQVLVDQLEHSDPKIAQRAAAIVLSKTLPEARFLKDWKGEKDRETEVEELGQLKEFLMWKMDRDVQEAEESQEAEIVETAESGHGDG
jgi:hypothetical protein